MKITVAGLGYVGTALAIALSSKYEVRAIDVDEGKVSFLRNGHSPIGDKETQKAIDKLGKLPFVTDDPALAYPGSDVVVIATSTNYDPKLNSFDTSHVEEVIGEISNRCPDATVVIKSTVPVGYTEEISRRFPSLRFVFSPEFLRESRAYLDTVSPSRIVVGLTKDDDENMRRGKEFAEALLSCSLSKDVPTLFVSSSEAEAIKLFSNAYLAMRVAFFNELDTYADSRGLSTAHLVKGVSLDPRIGDYYNNPSFGYGGYCLPKDTKQLKANFQSVPEKLITATVESNDTRKRFIYEDILSKANDFEEKNGRCPVIGIYRLVAKEGSDNFRESAVIDVIGLLQKSFDKLIVYEPKLSSPSFGGIEAVESFSAFVSRSDIILANRLSKELDPVIDKVYTRDLFSRD